MSFDYANMFSLKGQAVLVAGGAGAIGSACAAAAAAQGAKVAIADVSEPRIAEVTASFAAAGYEAIGLVMDMGSPDSVAQSIAAVEARFGPLTTAINCAGTHVEQPAEDVTLEAWDKVVNLNLRAAFVFSQGAARAMIAHKACPEPAERGGSSIIHITSVRSGLGIRRGYAAYCASKGGLAVLIKQLATEWAKYNIRVNGIAPTFTRTPLVADYLNDPKFYGDLVARIPMGRVAETSDIAGLAVFLASGASSLITGQNIFIDGGVTASQ